MATIPYANKYNWDADRAAAAEGKVTLHIGSQNRSGVIAAKGPRQYHAASPGRKWPAPSSRSLENHPVLSPG
jgi:hypothetical protein